MSAVIERDRPPVALSGYMGSYRATDREPFSHWTPAFVDHSAFVLHIDAHLHEAFSNARAQFERFATQQAQQEIIALKRLSYDWDGMGSEAPQGEAVAAALALLPALFEAIGQQEWRNPHVSASEDGEVTFEWWSDDRKITLYIAPHSVQFVRVWGPDIESEMENDDLDVSSFGRLWGWLYRA